MHHGPDLWTAARWDMQHSWRMFLALYQKPGLLLFDRAVNSFIRLGMATKMV
jgi:hypothetical protein